MEAAIDRIMQTYDLLMNHSAAASDEAREKVTEYVTTLPSEGVALSTDLLTTRSTGVGIAHPTPTTTVVVAGSDVQPFTVATTV